MEESGKSSRGGQSPAKSPLQQIARDPVALRRVHAAMHRFVDRLEAEVQDAVDAARSRRLAPIQGVAKVCRDLQRRYLPVGQIKETGGRYPRKPTGLAVEPDFVPGLMCLVPPRLAECVAELQKAIRAVQPYEGKPFERQPVVIGSPKEKAAVAACIQHNAPVHRRMRKRRRKLRRLRLSDHLEHLRCRFQSWQRRCGRFRRNRWQRPTWRFWRFRWPARRRLFVGW